jgi:hypothetical protein
MCNIDEDGYGHRSRIARVFEGKNKNFPPRWDDGDVSVPPSIDDVVVVVQVIVAAASAVAR